MAFTTRFGYESNRKNHYSPELTKYTYIYEPSSLGALLPTHSKQPGIVLWEDPQTDAIFCVLTPIFHSFIINFMSILMALTQKSN